MNEDIASLRSLESLKSAAEQWFAALCAHDGVARERLLRILPHALRVPTLRDVQYAIAVEQGYAGWVELQQQLLRELAATGETFATYELKAEALLEAYRTGTPAAMERHWGLTWHRRAWKAMRTYVQIDLGYAAHNELDISSNDARWLVAREHGFDDWAALVRVVNSAEQPPSTLAKPMTLLAHSIEQGTGGATPLSISRDWTQLLDDAQQGDVIGIDAHGQMTDTLLANIARLSQLTTLRLNGSQGVTDEGVRMLARLPNLQHLDLSGTAVTDQGVAELRALTKLRTLSLAWTRATDVGVSALAELGDIEHVNVGGTHCGDGAIRAFVDRAKLRHFSSGQATTDNGLSLFHEYPVFKRWQGGDVQMALLSHDTEPNRLQLRGQLSDSGVAQLRGLDGLFGLNLDDSAMPLTGRALQPLVDLPHLGWLAFDAKDDAMPVIARMPALRFLSCQDTSASDGGWVALSASQSIEQIWGRRCYGLERQGFLALARMPRLGHLSVSCKHVDDVGVSALPEFPVLRELMPMDIPDAGYRHIGKCSALESLVLMYCRDTTDVATEQLMGLSRLSKYFASYTQITDRTPELLAGISSLVEITFDSCAGLSDAGIAHLAQLPMLRELRVSGRGLTRAVTAPFHGLSVRVHYAL